jgi:hypothetical protein
MVRLKHLSLSEELRRKVVAVYRRQPSIVDSELQFLLKVLWLLCVYSKPTGDTFDGTSFMHSSSHSFDSLKLCHKATSHLGSGNDLPDSTSTVKVT